MSLIHCNLKYLTPDELYEEIAKLDGAYHMVIQPESLVPITYEGSINMKIHPEGGAPRYITLVPCSSLHRSE